MSDAEDVAFSHGWREGLWCGIYAASQKLMGRPVTAIPAWALDFIEPGDSCPTWQSVLGHNLYCAGWGQMMYYLGSQVDCGNCNSVAARLTMWMPNIDGIDAVKIMSGYRIEQPTPYAVQALARLKEPNEC